MNALPLDSAAPFGSCRMLMSMDNRIINGHPFKVWIGSHSVGHPLPDAFFRPAREAPIDRVPASIFIRQVPPGSAGAHNPQHRFQKPAMVRRHHTTVGHFPRQE